MEDLIYLVFIAAVIGAIVALLVAAFAVAATIASIAVFGAAVHAFAVAMYRGVVHRGGENAASGPGEPSFRAYYRGQVWRDLRLAAGASWAAAKRETSDIRQSFPLGSDPKVRAVLGAAFTVYAYVGLAIGALLAAIIGILPAIVIGLMASIAWAVGAPLRAIERLRRRRSGAFYDCQECHDRFPLPAYVCPDCNARHAKLAPGPFGVLRHRCTCGARLPAVQFRGRERLVAECPNGHTLGEGVGTVRTFHVPVAGGPSTGKSTFLAAALIELDEAAKAGKLATTVQSTSRQAYDRALDAFRKGVPAPKTSGLPPAVVAEVRGRSKSALLYAYDVAGEVYGVEDELRRDPAHGLAEGVVLLVDPFSLERVKLDLGKSIDQESELRPGAEAPQRMLERLIGVLEEQGVDLKQVAAAVCVTKIDALGIKDAIALAPGANDHERVEAWLEQEGAGNFLRAAEGAFAHVRCFGVSALGRMAGTGSGAFQPEGAAAPLLWLLSRAGVEPAAPGEAEKTHSEKITSRAPLAVTPKRPLYRSPIEDVSPVGRAANFGLGFLATGALILAALPFAGTDGNETSFARASFSGESSTEETSDPTTVDTTSSPDSSTEESTAEEPDTTDDTEPETSSAGRRGNPNSPTRTLRRHFQRLAAGNYQGAFKLMAAGYQAAHPNWTSQPNAAQPYVNVVELGDADFVGGGVAYVPIKFYGHDRFETPASDTKCRRFEGTAKMVKQNGAWRYDPTGNNYSVSELPSDLGVCNP